MILVIVVVAGGLSATAWHKVVRHYFVARNFGVVEPGAIYRSGRLKPLVINRLHDRFGLKTIVDLGAYPAGSPQDLAEQAIAEQLGMTRHSLHLIGDGTGDPNGYLEVVRLMADPDNHPMLVHCAAGSERTTTAVVLYRHLVQGKSIRDGYPESFDYRHDPDSWHLLAYLADNLEVLREAWETGQPVVVDETGHYVLGSP